MNEKARLKMREFNEKKKKYYIYIKYKLLILDKI